jgi:chemotaxis protein MotB
MAMPSTARIPVFLLCLASFACVSSGKYDTLQKQLDDTRATLSGRVADLEGQIKAKDQEIAAAKSQHAEDTEATKRLEAERAKLETELTATVKDKAALKASADDLKNALAESNKRKAEAEKRIAEMKQLLAQLKSMIDAGKLRVKIADGRMVLELPSDVLFASGSADLSPAGLTTIAQVTTALLTLQRKLQVEGHTDNVPIHTTRFPSNWALGAARAITIVNTMVAAGMNPAQLSAASYGDFKPVAPNDSDVNKGKNRRIEIVIVPDLSMLPGFDELQKTLGS